jgi:hypothetical protein
MGSELPTIRPESHLSLPTTPLLDSFQIATTRPESAVLTAPVHVPVLTAFLDNLGECVVAS